MKVPPFQKVAFYMDLLQKETNVEYKQRRKPRPRLNIDNSVKYDDDHWPDDPQPKKKARTKKREGGTRGARNELGGARRRRAAASDDDDLYPRPEETVEDPCVEREAAARSHSASSSFCVPSSWEASPMPSPRIRVEQGPEAPASPRWSPMPSPRTPVEPPASLTAAGPEASRMPSPVPPVPVPPVVPIRREESPAASIRSRASEAEASVPAVPALDTLRDAAARRTVGAHMPFGAGRFTPTYDNRTHLQRGYQMNCGHACHNLKGKPRCTKSKNSSLVGGHEMCLRLLKWWAVGGHKMESKAKQ